MFENIKNINLTDETTWKDKIFITIDIDWVSDEILSYTLDIIEKSNIKVTFFVTHETRLLERMRKNPKIELGIHPNFNPLLNGDFRYGKNIEEVIKYYMEIIPEAVSVRSHSITQSAKILEKFNKFGIRFDCNHFIPYNSNIELKPWFISKELIKVPYFWEDDIHCLNNWEWDIDKFIETKGIKVFDFHCIHIFLNTENLNRYEISKKYHKNIKKLVNYCCNDKDKGTKIFLENLIKRCKR